MICTYDYVNDVVHLYWDQDEQQYLYMFLRTACEQSTVSKKYSTNINQEYFKNMHRFS